MLASFIKLAGLPVLAYLLGSIPWGILIAARLTAKDIRQHGSGNIGATNALRIAGLRAGILVLAGDVLKGALPVYLASLLANPCTAAGQLYTAFIALAAFFGHLYPLYLGFRNGGKGVATALGCLLIMAPLTAMITLLVFILMCCISNRASVGSLTGAVVLPPVMWLTSHAWIPTLTAAVIAVFVLLRHKDNIVRLLRGTESVIWKQRP